MSDLFERSKLTEEERDEAWESAKDGGESDALADAAAKALWAEVEWLDEMTKAFPRGSPAWYGARVLAESYEGEVLKAGFERPTLTEGVVMP